MLDPEDLEAEALLALARCVRKYLHAKGYAEFLAIARSSMSNAVGTLVYKATLTHRRVETVRARMLELDAPFTDDDDADDLNDIIPGGTEPEEQFMSMERVGQLVGCLTSFELTVYDALLGGNCRVARFLKLHADRSHAVHKDPAVRIDLYVISNAILADEDDVRDAMRNIRRKYQEVMNG